MPETFPFKYFNSSIRVATFTTLASKWYHNSITKLLNPPPFGGVPIHSVIYVRSIWLLLEVLAHLNWHEMRTFWHLNQALQTNWESQTFCLCVQQKTAGMCQQSPRQCPSSGFLFLCIKTGSLPMSLGPVWEPQKRHKGIFRTTLKTLVYNKAKFHVLCFFTGSYFPLGK